MNKKNKKNLAYRKNIKYIAQSIPAKPLLESLILAGFMVFRGSYEV